MLEIPIDEYQLTGYHVNTAKCIRPDNSIEHRDVHGDILVQVPSLSTCMRSAYRE